MSVVELSKRKIKSLFAGQIQYNRNTPEQIVEKGLRQAIDVAIDSGKTVFICGMARGVDLWAGQVVAERKKENPALRLICATPYIGFERTWAPHWQEL